MFEKNPVEGELSLVGGGLQVVHQVAVRGLKDPIHEGDDVGRTEDQR